MVDKREAPDDREETRKTGLPWGDLILAWIVGPIVWGIVFYAATFVSMWITRGQPLTVVFVFPTLAASTACAWRTATFVEELPLSAGLPALIVANAIYAVVLWTMGRLHAGSHAEVYLLPVAGLAMGLLVIYLIARRVRAGQADG